MNFLSIWIGDTFDSRRIPCVESILSHVRKKDTFHFISEIQPIKSKKIKYVSFNLFVDEMLKENELIRDFWNNMKENEHFSRKTDIIRYYFSSKVKQTLYIDTDVILKTIPLLDTSCQFAQKGIKRKDSFLFWNGDDTKIGMEILEKAIKKSNIVIPRSWCYVILKKIQTKTISSEHFTHLNFQQG
jgi:hypothetical protein